LVTIITNLLLLVLIIQTFYWYYFFSELLEDEEKLKSTVKAPISIIICAHNESENVDCVIPQLLQQNHSDYKIVLVDDYSTDDTMVRAIQYASDKKLTVIQNEGSRGKKYALTTGIESVSTPYILLTDADCRVGQEWLTTMESAILTDKIDIVLGYSPSIVLESFISKWAHYENWLIALQYLSFARRSIPYMGVGRNLLYRKAIVSEHQILKYSYLLSGDDDLTVMQLAGPSNTSICLNPQGFAWTEAPASTTAYISQKRRHFSTARYYKWYHQVLLASYALSHILFFVFSFLLCANGACFHAILFLFIRYVLVVPIARKLLNKMASPLNTFQFLCMDFVQLIYYLIFSLAIIFPKKSSWN
jgi:glycosyltransferase involved in cell wall biosynthesis